MCGWMWPIALCSTCQSVNEVVDGMMHDRTYTLSAWVEASWEDRIRQLLMCVTRLV